MKRIRCLLRGHDWQNTDRLSPPNRRCRRCGKHTRFGFFETTVLR